MHFYLFAVHLLCTYRPIWDAQAWNDLQIYILTFNALVITRIKTCSTKTYTPDPYYRGEKKNHKGKNVKNTNFCSAKKPTSAEAPEVLADNSNSLCHLQSQLLSKDFSAEKGKESRVVRQQSQNDQQFRRTAEASTRSAPCLSAATVFYRSYCKSWRARRVGAAVGRDFCLLHWDIKPALHYAFVPLHSTFVPLQRNFHISMSDNITAYTRFFTVSISDEICLLPCLDH